ncbi:MAG: carotenoid biosynthesis protein [Planctomycetota bacterium]|jgi:hypothetical protein|nr:carotenoid biosynthesis protein [Planctomycetota bacterium]
MIVVQFVCLGIVALYVVARVRNVPDPSSFCRRLCFLAVASWIAEETMILAYRFYRYDPQWNLFLGHVPLAIALIWPVVIHSAWDLAGALVRSKRVAFLGGLLVLADASLIEPIAVASGFWSWEVPGLFEVPLVGLIGWALFAGMAIRVLESNRMGSWVRDLWVLVVPGLFAHLGVLAFWWGGLRWFQREIPGEWACLVGWCLSLFLSGVVLRYQLGKRVSSSDLFLRIPPALFFYALVFGYGMQSSYLLIYSMAFAPPYVFLTIRSARIQESPSGDEYVVD